jgi:hypothetical protein
LNNEVVKRRTAIASFALIVVAIIIIVAVGISGYELNIYFATGHSSTISTEISSTCSNSTNPTLPSANLAEMFGNFTKMTMTATIVANGSLSSFVSSYSVLNNSNSENPLIYSVDLNGTTSSPTGKFSENVIFKYGSNGTILATNLKDMSFAISTEIILVYLIPFTLEVQVGSLLSSQFDSSVVKQLNTTQITLGPTTMSVTNYAPVQLPFTYNYCESSSTISGEENQIGTVPGTSFGHLITYLYLEETISSGLVSDTFQVVSLTPTVLGSSLTT